MLALHGIDVYGLDISATGVSEAKKIPCLSCSVHEDTISSCDSERPIDVGSVHFIGGNSEWKRQALAFDKRFNSVCDNTTCRLCTRIAKGMLLTG